MIKKLDILIIGAGISGIGMAAHLKRQCPTRQFDIVERRESFGGTWDLFQYPGIRSDSDMSTFGYNFKPWNQSSVLATGPAIKAYLSEVIDEYQLNDHIHFQHRVLKANYHSETSTWQIEVETSKGVVEEWHANFVVSCTGYYNYDQGYQPDFPNQTAFKGSIIHPQHWPDDLNYQNKKVVVIGSGATAITLVPAMVKGGASHVTMLQRSPTYIASVPSLDLIYDKMRKFLPAELAYSCTRERNIYTQRGIYYLAQKYPKIIRRLLLSAIRWQLKGKVDMKHFTPTYAPWDQRLCVVPDGDLFEVLRNGQADVMTDQIQHFDATGIQLKSGQHVDADIIVSATGLNIQILGGIQAQVDGQAVDTSQSMLYQGIMVSDVPNMAMMIGYINASWTLKVDIAAEYICRLLNHAEQHGYRQIMAKSDPDAMLNDTVMGSLSAGYIARAANVMPKQGKYAPWRITNNYVADRKVLKQASFHDPVLKFTA